MDEASSSLRPLGRGVVLLSLATVAVFSVYPLLFMALSSMRDSHSYQLNPVGLPKSPSIDNFRVLLSDYPIFDGLIHSVIVVIPAVMLGTLLSALAAFTMTKAPFRGSESLFSLLLVVMVMPAIVLLIPIYIGIARAGLANSFVPAIAVYAAINIPLGTYLMRASYRSFPDALLDAAALDGAGILRTFFLIVVPASRASIGAVAVLTFVNTWNDLIISIMLLHTPETQMLMPALAQIAGTYTTDVPVLMAGLLVAALPVVLTLLVTRRFFVSGLTVGAMR